MTTLRAAFFEPNRDLATNPSLMGTIAAMVQSGWEVDLFMPPHAEFPHVSFPNIRRHPFPGRPPILPSRIKQTCKAWIEFLPTIMPMRKGARCGYHIVFGIDCAGIIAASDYCRDLGVPLIYLSYEILFTDELKTRRWKRIKEKEIAACQRVDCVVVQDAKRAQLLSEENRIDASKFILLPVAPSKKSTTRSNWLREHLGIPPEKSIVLHSGSLAEWTGAEELLRSVTSWPENFVLVIHTRYRPTRFDPFLRTIGNKRASNVFLSSDPLTMEEYDKLVSSADIGLALYRPGGNSPFTQKNLEYVGLSSGKFSFYMKHGLPTVTMDQPIYKTLSGDYQFGEVITDFQNLPAALLGIQANYEYCRHEAKRLFAERLDFDTFWPAIETRIDALLSGFLPYAADQSSNYLTIGG